MKVRQPPAECPRAPPGPSRRRIARESIEGGAYHPRRTIGREELLRDKLSAVLDLGLAYEHYSAKLADHREATRAWSERRDGVFTGE